MTISKISSPLLALSLSCLLAACDEGDPQSLDRAASAGQVDEPITFRGGNMRGGSGSTRLNTAKLNGDFEIGNFARMRDNGSPSIWVWGESSNTQIEFTRARFTLHCESPQSLALANRIENGDKCLHTFMAGQHEIEIDRGRANIDQIQLTTTDMLGSEWSFTIIGEDAQHNPMPPKFATVTVIGAAEANVPSAGESSTVVPLYNFELSAFVDGYGSDLLETAGICEKLDSTTVQSMQIAQIIDHWDPNTPNLWDAEYAGTFYGGVAVDGGSGEVTADSELIFIGCASGAMVKAALWGYPPYVDTAMGMNGVQQLQAATRAIRADYCADGTSHTEVGTPIQIVDRFTPSFDRPKQASETIWGGNGSLSEVFTPRMGAYNANGICGSGAMLAPQVLSGESLLPQHIVPTLGSLVDWHQLGSEWITVNDRKFMWTRFSGGNDVGAVADASCCVNSLIPGCATAQVSACVGAYDSYCTDVAWDSYCVQEVEWLDCGVC